jgi:hypothetical protein
LWKFIFHIFLNRTIVNLPSTARDDLYQKIFLDTKASLLVELFAQAQKEMFVIMLGAHERYASRRERRKNKA